MTIEDMLHQIKRTHDANRQVAEDNTAHRMDRYQAQLDNHAIEAHLREMLNKALVPPVVIEVDELAPMLNGRNGLKRMHWTKYAEIRDKWVWLLRWKTKAKFTGKVRIDHERHSVKPPDADNLASQFKVIGDALVRCGVIEDDSVKVISGGLHPKWVKAKNNKAQKTVIKITKMEE